MSDVRLFAALRVVSATDGETSTVNGLIRDALRNVRCDKLFKVRSQQTSRTNTSVTIILWQSKSVIIY